MIVVIYEWFNSSIEIKTKNYFYSLPVTVGYTITVLVYSLSTKKTLYYSSNWNKNPWESAIIAAVVFVINYFNYIVIIIFQYI